MIQKNITQLKLDLLRKNSHSLLSTSKNTYIFLKILLKLGLIASFKKIKINNLKKYKAVFSYNCGKISLKKIIIFKKSKANTCCSYNVLKKINRDNICILSSNKGVVELNSSIINRNGGMILCKIIV
jgi:ribosomal protein S8